MTFPNVSWSFSVREAYLNVVSPSELSIHMRSRPGHSAYRIHDRGYVYKKTRFIQANFRIWNLSGIQQCVYFYIANKIESHREYFRVLYSKVGYLKMTWTVIYYYRRQVIFCDELLSATGYWLGVCHGWFHLHGLPLAARNGSEIYKTKNTSCPKRDSNSRPFDCEAIAFTARPRRSSYQRVKS